jgi:hypothetical protein
VAEETQNPSLPKDVQVHLSRVIVPNFRVLKDIDITFEPDLVPRIFPLGSLNGGGKSTLLQLIFTLLYSCGESADPSFLENILNGFPINQLVSTIECMVDGVLVRLEFNTSSVKYVSKMNTEKRMFLQGERKYQCLFDICDYIAPSLDPGFLVCKLSVFKTSAFLPNPINSISLEDSVALETLNTISRSVFLAAPITQSFRFIDPEVRELAVSIID